MAFTRRRFIRVLTGSAVVLGAGAIGLSQCDQMPPEAIAAWGGPGPNETEPRRRALAVALLAPNPHNTQPWIADLREPDAVTLYADQTRLLPETDPPSRQIMIGCGAFLELLRMAAAAQGYQTAVTLFPEGAWAGDQVGATPFARIAFTKQGDLSADPLFSQAFARRTNRNAYGADPVTADEAAAIAESVAAFPVRVGWTDEAERVKRLKAIALQGWEIEVSTDATYLESVNVYRITGDQIAAHRDGISMHGPMMWWLNRTGVFTREKAASGDPFLRDQARSFVADQIAATPSFLWMITDRNDRETQLASGAAYLRACLKANALGVSIQPLSQALQEFAEMAGPYQAIKDALGAAPSQTIQMFVRIGRGAMPGPSPRRPLDALLRV